MCKDLHRLVRLVHSSHKSNNGEVKPFSDYLTVPNIVLLGDPGAGKTHTFGMAAKKEGVVCHAIRDFLSLVNNTGEETVYLDGLDEYRSRSDDKNLIIELIKQLNQHGQPKLRLSCRIADWLGDNDLDRFKFYFGAAPYVVLLLEPLSEQEIAVILQSRKVVAPDDFIDRAKSLNIDNLLGNPQTLIMLADVVSQGSSWPATRKELFEKSCKILLEEPNRERVGTGQGIFSSDELKEPAGAVAALLLISGVPGISLLEGGCQNSDFPSYKTAGYLPHKQLSACLMRRCFASVDPQNEAVALIHRTIAEFLGARWLAANIRKGHPLYRVLNLIGQDGQPATELRGLHAWLPVFLPEYAEVFIKNDPYGILMYGDAASLSHVNRNILLSSLVTLSEQDPWFRANDWSDTPLSALSGADMVKSFQKILNNPDSSLQLRSLVLGVIANGPDLPQISKTLAGLVTSNENYHEATLAVEGLFNVVPNGDQKLIDIFHVTLKKDVTTARLRGEILSRLYENNFQPVDILDVCRDVLLDTDKYAFGELWGLPASLPHTALPEILNTLCALNTGEKFEGEKTNQHIIESVFERILSRLLQTDFIPQEKMLWQWLTCLHFLGGRRPYRGDDYISSWLKQNKNTVFVMLLLAIEQVKDGRYWQFWSDFEKITRQALVGEDLVRMVLAKLEETTELSDADYALYEKCGSMIFWIAPPKCMLELLAAFQSLTLTHSSLQALCDKYCRCEIEDWRLKDAQKALERQEKDEKQRVVNQHNLDKTREAIKAGEHLFNIGFLAMTYFARFSDVDNSLSPVERLSGIIGREYVDLALSGFVAILDRDDMPSPGDVALSLSQDKYFTWWYAVLAGINEVWLRQGKSLVAFSDKQLQSALAITISFPVNSEEDKDREWVPQLLTERQDIVGFVYEEMARVELQQDKSHINVLYSLCHGEETKDWRSRVALRLLRQFPCCSPDCLKMLTIAGIYASNYRSTLVKFVKHGIVSCHGEQREIWLVVGFLLAPDLFGELLKKHSERHKKIVWILRDLSQRVVVQETDKALQLSITQLEYCILVSGRVFGNVFMPSGGSRGDQNDWDGAEFVRNKINQLAAIPDKESSEVLQRLLTEGSLSTYQDQLKHSLANQMVIRRNAEYRLPLWAETVESLRGGKPANIADLHALILDQMQTIKKRIKAGNTDTYKAFWRCDSNGKVERPEIEDICRDRFIELLEPSLLPLELHAEPEGHMAAEKRADIIIFGSGSMKLPVECKRDFHADIWTACTNQLEQMYSRDPGAKGYGIYGVFWFGDKRTSRMKNPPGGITKPQSAEELEQALQSLVPQEQQMKIRVVVFDVTPPY